METMQGLLGTFLQSQFDNLKAENKQLRDALENIDALIDNINSDSVAITLTSIKYRIQQALQDEVLQSPDVPKDAP